MLYFLNLDQEGLFSKESYHSILQKYTIRILNSDTQFSSGPQNVIVNEINFLKNSRFKRTCQLSVVVHGFISH